MAEEQTPEKWVGNRVQVSLKGRAQSEGADGFLEEVNDRGIVLLFSPEFSVGPDDPGIQFSPRYLFYAWDIVEFIQYEHGDEGNSTAQD
jgi:hypothetical protein